MHSFIDARELSKSSSNSKPWSVYRSQSKISAQIFESLHFTYSIHTWFSYHPSLLEENILKYDEANRVMNNRASLENVTMVGEFSSSDGAVYKPKVVKHKNFSKFF